MGRRDVSGVAGRADVTEETTASATRRAASATARGGDSARGTSQAGAGAAVPGPRATPVAPAAPGPSAAPVPSAGGREARDQVTVCLPAEGAYLSVLRTATAGLAARLDFTLDEIEDLRIAVDEACAMLLGQAVPGTALECTFTLGRDLMTISVSVLSQTAKPPASDTFAWTVLTALAGSVEARVGPGNRLTIVLQKSRELSGSV
jgi:serine/threonine-protein kinase RsbW